MSVLATGYSYTVLAAFSWSLTALFAKSMLSAGLSPLEVSFWRASIGGLCFLVNAFVAGTLKIRFSHALLFVLWGMMSIGGLYYVFLLSIQHSGAAMGEILLYTAPIWVAVFTRLFSREEEVSPRKWMAILIALCGVGFVCFSGGSLQGRYSTLGILCGLASGLCYAFQYPFFKHWQKRYRTESIYAYMHLGGVMVLLPIIQFDVPYTPQTWVTAVLMAVLTGYLAFWAYGQGLKRAPQVHVAVLCNLEPILGTLWVCIFFGENFTPVGWAGFFLILSAIFILATDRGKQYAV
ncbi:DMT family transporter [Desulfovibrio sp. Fe33]|uniref:DMT family transporter n=1 Tax=Desulfovibrio sp. Fe33 TaxID=3020842 RepID=UPI00234DE4FB|nr:DMT family transporter [Desulfovibrio sp. Fe33]